MWSHSFHPSLYDSFALKWFFFWFSDIIFQYSTWLWEGAFIDTELSPPPSLKNVSHSLQASQTPFPPAMCNYIVSPNCRLFVTFQLFTFAISAVGNSLPLLLSGFRVLHLCPHLIICLWTWPCPSFISYIKICICISRRTKSLYG